MNSSEAIVVGAGPAGLACAASLRAVGIEALLLEKAGEVGAVWRRHYDRLHLHTDRDHSGLPLMAMPRSLPKYPSRAELIAYLETYAARFAIRPAFNVEVARIERDGRMWRVEAGAHSARAPVVVIATGTADSPYRPTWPGVEAFRGAIIHSSAYRNPAPYVTQRTLVVGYGNSGGEIALDLADAGVDVTLAVRGPVQILPRDLLGLPILSWAILYRRLPARLVDVLNAPMLRLAVGDTARYGLRRPAKGPRQRVEEDGRVPVFDVGTLARIRDGAIKVRGGIDHFTADGVAFLDATCERFDAVILATGFRPDLRPLVPGAPGLFDRRGLPLVSGRATSEPGLYFCGLAVSPTGQLREIGIEAARIAALARIYVAAFA